MSNHEAVLTMNVDGVLYPVGMTEEQLTMFRLFVATISRDSPLNVLKKAPIAEAHEVAEKVNAAYGIKVVK